VRVERQTPPPRQVDDSARSLRAGYAAAFSLPLFLLVGALVLLVGASGKYRMVRAAARPGQRWRMACEQPPRARLQVEPGGSVLTNFFAVLRIAFRKKLRGESGTGRPRARGAAAP
jgi:hypothetical protein